MTKDIMLAIAGLLAKAYPDRKVYLDDVPQNFTRPSFLISFVTNTHHDAAFSLIQSTDYFQITIYGTTNEYYDTQSPSMLEDELDVLDLFMPGVITVGDRALHITASGGGRMEAEAYVDVTVEYMRDSNRGDNSAKPLMQTVDVDYQVRK